VKLELVRDGKPVVLPVKLGEMPGEAPSRVAAPKARSGALDGLTLEPLSTATRRKFNIPDEQRQGVVVTALDPMSPAARARLRPGDVLVEVNRQPVNGIEGFRELYRQNGKRLLLLVYRDGKTSYVVVRK
jgi:serine protease Do